MIIKLLVDGGEMKPGPAVAQKIGPLGINMGKIIQDVNKATAEFKGTKVPVSLDVDPKAKTYKIEVSSPPTSELLKKEFGLESGSGDHKKNKIANASIEQVIKVAKTKHSSMLAKEFKSAVKSVVGSCVSLGILVENKLGTETSKDIEAGVYDKEIKAQKTETSDEKKAKLKEYFENVLKDQENIKKAEEAAKAAAEAAKAAAVPAAGAAPAAAAGAAAGAKAAAPAAGAAAPAAGAKAAAAPAKGKEEKKK
jgi:large subunit ribosomal protein L11